MAAGIAAPHSAPTHLLSVARPPLEETGRRYRQGDEWVAGTGEAAGVGRTLETPDEVRGSVNGYVEFGSHGLRHGWLPNLDLAEQEDEISGSVERCASLTGSRPAAFAYPYGMFDRRSERLTQEAGFDCACTTRNVGVSRVSRSFALPRVKVGNNDSAGLQRTLTRVRAD